MSNYRVQAFLRSDIDHDCWWRQGELSSSHAVEMLSLKQDKEMRDTAPKGPTRALISPSYILFFCIELITSVGG